ncbi:unnamed protein product [Rhizophagus irregularis]|uniref:Uncharacterized protein n=1 Tax=Rhizophagus irregularis TaxID=588596 RepID=A0A2N1N6J5_9GLOM|nr:hypothetical protein RhiirC2_866680 [Rhizophagus irregularis]CAB4398155.1 unnamed protein product [Rhizophagus irregularis]CAB5354482.1 unnamed protein product [Rhizophagus irregularis]
MDKKNTQTKQQATENSTSDARRTRHSTRIQERAMDATAVVSHKATISDVSRTRRAARSTSTSNSSKRKHEGVNEKDNTANATNTKRSKKFKITSSSSNLISKQPSTAIVQEALVASLVVIQDTVPRVTKYNKM